MKFWDPTIEKMPKKELTKLQRKKLRNILSYVYKHSAFYRRRFDNFEVKPDDIKSIEDLKKLPFTVKNDFRETYPTGMFCVPQSQILRYHASSGTTGKPTLVSYTKNDIHEWSTSLARGLTSIGVGRGDILQNSYGYGLFTGGLGFHYAAEMIGALTIPTGAGSTERQIEFIKDLGTTVITCTPSYFLHIKETAKNIGVDLKKTRLRAGVFGAEPWSENMRRRIEDTGLKAYDVYGTSELSGPLFTECSFQNGIHVWADQFLIEIIDPETGENLEDGERGELVVTTLAKEALPLIRYRVGDLTVLNSDVCECGRTHPRIMRIQGRTDDMLVIRGINVFPSQVESAIMRLPELGDNYQIIVDRVHELDTLTVKAEVVDKFPVNNMNELASLKRKVAYVLRNALNLDVNVELVNPGTLPQSTGKAKRVIDNRKI
ncbi:MAG: phenylacetate--CoA ligase [Candidatus Bathyarchaeia archaeon]